MFLQKKILYMIQLLRITISSLDRIMVRELANLKFVRLDPAEYVESCYEDAYKGVFSDCVFLFACLFCFASVT